MQTKKKASRRNGSQECTSPKVSRAQKKASDNSQVVEKKVADLITSSARKIKPRKLSVVVLFLQYILILISNLLMTMGIFILFSYRNFYHSESEPCCYFI